MEDTMFICRFRVIFRQTTLLCVIISALMSSSSIVVAIKTYQMENNCNDDISMFEDSIYQGKLILNTPGTSFIYLWGSGSLECKTTIEARYTMNNLMFYFEKLDLSCSDGYLEFYDRNYYAVTGLEGRICGINKPSAVYTTATIDLKVKYTALKNKYKVEAASIIFTAYMDGSSCYSYDYECANGRCIDDDVSCNGYNSCGDNSDCRLGAGAIAGIIIGSLVGVCILVTVVVVVICCKRQQKRRNNMPSGAVIYTANAPGQQPYVVYGAQNQPVVAGQQPAYPSNWSNPGYMSRQAQAPPVYPGYPATPASGIQGQQQIPTQQVPVGQGQFQAPSSHAVFDPPPAYGDLNKTGEDEHVYEHIPS